MSFVRGVTFDLDDTLWCGKTVLSNATNRFHTYIQSRAPLLSTSYPPDAFSKLLIHFQKTLPNHAHDYTLLRKHTLLHCATLVGGHRALGFTSEEELKAFVDESCETFLEARSQPQIFEGVPEMLAELNTFLRTNDTQREKEDSHQHSKRIGVITNGNCRFNCLPQTLRDMFDFVISAETAKKAKPHRLIFEAAIKQYSESANPHEFVHVGDHYRCDIEGAKCAGMRTIWVNPLWEGENVYSRIEGEDAYAAADAIIKSIKDVMKVLVHWQNEAQLKKA
uniref:Haloacid dehalogenaselike hydrolase putative n=1 Tax=Albugo laibachii Nc14 TaxID=890382 RepID=F0W1S7_9STRA|nr:haloacid dehalogenaselike hydrolase putative [Albugo laibachii Nc14]CCA25497.1 haloacid dehalogenaselike hydrolase putative [Albugo laibachii Nc14]|eukprot:CCA25497.1 haloacid dehalogenaselike hydrolase putative [Albugo laibachii Nc14]